MILKINRYFVLMSLVVLTFLITHVAYANPASGITDLSKTFSSGFILLLRILVAVICGASLIGIAGKFGIDTMNGNQQAKFGAAAWSGIGVLFLLFVVVVFGPTAFEGVFSGSDISSPFES